MKETITRSDLHFYPKRFIRSLVIIAISILVPIIVVGKLAGKPAGELRSVSVFFATLAVMSTALAFSILYTKARRVTPRTIEIVDRRLVFSTPKYSVAVSLSLCTWKRSSATKDDYLGLFLSDRECFVLTVKGRSSVAVGYTSSKSEEWQNVPTQGDERA